MPQRRLTNAAATYGSRTVPAAPRPAARDPARHAPVILLSPIRSYSSVVTTMIGCHPELFGFPELLLWIAPTVGSLLADPTREGSPGVPAFPGGLVRAIAHLHSAAQGPAEVAAARAWLLARRSWATRDVHDYLLRLVEPRRGVEKTPQTVTTPGALARAARAYPRAQFLHLTRHPATALPSIYDHWQWSRHARGFPADLPPDAAAGQRVASAAVWLVAHRNALRFAAGAGEGRVLRVRGEDVLREPGPQLTRVARWLGISDDPAFVGQMLHPERSPFARPGPSEARMGNDRKFLSQPVPRRVQCPSGHRLPASLNLPRRLAAKIEQVAADLGY